MSKELPSIEELRESQRKGAEGIGTATQTYAETQADFNMGTGVPVEGTDSQGDGYKEPWM